MGLLVLRINVSFLAQIFYFYLEIVSQVYGKNISEKDHIQYVNSATADTRMFYLVMVY